MPVQVRNDVAEELDVHMIWFHRAHDRLLSGVQVGGERQPFRPRQLIEPRGVAWIEDQLTLPAIRLVPREVQR
jgi:hypothetical protein